MLKPTNVYENNTYSISMSRETYSKLLSQGKLYHDNREPRGSNALIMFYRIFFGKYNKGNHMFFMWDEGGYDGTYDELEYSDFVLVTLEIPNSVRIIHTDFDKWNSIVSILDLNRCDLIRYDEYLSRFSDRSFEKDLQELVGRDYGDQHLVGYIDAHWVRTVVYIDRLLRS